MVELLSIEQRNGLRLAGELDMSTAPELDTAFEAVVEQGGAVLVDLSELTFMDSTGIKAILKATLALRGRGCLILHGERHGVRRVLDVAGLDGFVPNLHRVHIDSEPAVEPETV